MPSRERHPVRTLGARILQKRQVCATTGPQNLKSPRGALSDSRSGGRIVIFRAALALLQFKSDGG